jgi:hypothetical protein
MTILCDETNDLPHCIFFVNRSLALPLCRFFDVSPAMTYNQRFYVKTMR